MIQLYFLSILCNGLAGYILVCEDNDIKEPVIPVNNPTFHLVLGILCAVSGILKLLSPIKGVIIFGDLLPAAAGIIAGFMLLYGVNRQNLTIEAKGLDRIGTNLLVFRKQIGRILLLISVLHFVLAEVPLF